MSKVNASIARATIINKIEAPKSTRSFLVLDSESYMATQRRDKGSAAIIPTFHVHC